MSDSKVGPAAMGAGMITLCLVFVVGIVAIAIKGADAITEYDPVVKVIYCDGEEIAQVTPISGSGPTQPRINSDRIYWYKNGTRTQLRIDHCQNLTITSTPIKQ